MPLGADRVIVSMPGTTRFHRLLVLGTDFVLIDTAGMRRKARSTCRSNGSVVRDLRAVDRSDIAVLVIDATEGVAEQDTKIAGYVHEAGKGCIIVINKWDLVERTARRAISSKKISDGTGLPPVRPDSLRFGLTKQRINRLADMVGRIGTWQHMRISTSVLNELIEDASHQSAAGQGGRLLKIYYMTQASVQPPTFILFVNEPQLMHFSYLRFLTDCDLRLEGFAPSAHLAWQAGW